MKVIGGLQIGIVMVMISIAFQHLESIIHVHFIVIVYYIPTFLSMRDMVTNGPKHLIQNCHVRFQNDGGG